MAAVFKQCPFCNRVFEIGSRDHEPMRRHIRLMHASAVETDSRSNREHPVRFTN